MQSEVLKGFLLHNTLRGAHLLLLIYPQLFPSNSNVDITSFIFIVVGCLATPPICKGIEERSFGLTSCRCNMIVVHY